MESQWWYGNKDEKVGPVSRAELVQQFGDEKLSLDTFVWKAGWGEWRKLADVEELQAEVQAAVRERKRTIPPPLPNSPVEAQQPVLAALEDLTPTTFGLRVGALFGGYTLFALVLKGHFFVALGQSIGVALAATILFLIVWGGKRLFGQRMKTPLREAFMLGVSVAVVFAVLAVISLRITQITG